MAKTKVLEKTVRDLVFGFLRDRRWRIVKTEFSAMPGVRATGEPGMADCVAIRYMGAPEVPTRALALWIEFKGPNDRRTCFCDPSTPKKLCKVCRQKHWQERERGRGAVVIVVNSFPDFCAWYQHNLSFLHSETTPLGEAPEPEQPALF